MRTVKFKGNIEPCTVYRVSESQLPVLQYSKYLKKICTHIFIEVVGYTPEELLEDASENVYNTFAIDRKMFFDNRLS